MKNIKKFTAGLVSVDRPLTFGRRPGAKPNSIRPEKRRRIVLRDGLMLLQRRFVFDERPRGQGSREGAC